MSAEEKPEISASISREEENKAEQQESEEVGRNEEEVETTQQRTIHAEIGEMTELESLCPKCGNNGVTRLMMTTIPHFREVIVSSFECSHCGERNNEIQFGGEFGEKHVRFELEVEEQKDLNRQVVKSEYATIFIPELELEIPPNSQRGQLNTVEGILAVTAEGLQQEQPVRRRMQPEVARKIDDFCEKLQSYRELKEPFNLVLDDPAGNSYIEAIYDYYHPTIDPKIKKIETWRTDIERQMLGLAVEYNHGRTTDQENLVEEGNLDDGEVLELPLECPACLKMGMLRSHKCDIPYFKETLIMCFKCDQCGYKSTEVKNGGGIAPRGCVQTLTLESSSDLSRDILKSDSCSVSIPEIQLELAPGTLGGFFSTVEGLLNQVHDHLKSVRQLAFEEGDAAVKYDDPNQEKDNPKMKIFLNNLSELREGKKFPFTLILDDPLANVYVQNPKAHLPPPDNEDTQLKIKYYERSAEINDDLGITALLRMKGEEDAATAAADAITTAGGDHEPGPALD